jgi:preprotein translocase subunit SecG
MKEKLTILLFAAILAILFLVCWFARQHTYPHAYAPIAGNESIISRIFRALGLQNNLIELTLILIVLFLLILMVLLLIFLIVF